MILVCGFYGLCVTPMMLMIFGSDNIEKDQFNKEIPKD